MKLCETCTKQNCKHSIVEIKQDNLITIKCLDHEKDVDKIKGYKKPLNRTARQCDTLMKLNI